MLNLLLVQPVDNYGPNKFLPLAISYQWMYATTDPWVNKNWQVVDVIIDKPNIKETVENLSRIDLAAFSCYVWNWSYNLELAKEIKKKYPNCKIVLGGPNVDKRNRDFFDANPQIDYAITGEGELAFKSLLQSYQGNFKIKEKNFFDKFSLMSHLPTRLNQLDEIPSPILTGFYDQIFDFYKKRVLPEALWQVTFETLRGCPYHCAFCDIGDSYWNKVKTFNIDRVKQEIDWMADRKIEYVSVCDSNWGMLERDKEITEYVIKKKKETGFPKFWDVTWAKNNSDRIFEIAKTEKESETQLFKGVTFAMQSFNKDALQATDRFNINEDIATYYLKKYQEENIPTYSELIWPMPNETVETLMDGIQNLINLGQKDFLMVHPLVLTPNAPMGQIPFRKKWKLETAEVPLDTFYLKVEDPENYVVEYTEAVISTNTCTYKEMLEGHLQSYILITFFYYGWAYCLMEYLKSKENIRHVDFAKRILDYFGETDTLIGKEIKQTKNSYIGVFEKKQFWGRSPTDNIDVLWDYKGASSIVFDLNRNQLKKELKCFLHDVYNIDNEKLIEINEAMCFNFRESYPKILKTDPDIVKNLFNLNSNKVQIDHYDQNTSFFDQTDFHYKAYHYQRKNRYWQCNVKEI